jgi:hypothetical protein
VSESTKSIIKIEGWLFVSEPGEPRRIHDLELARRLGYSRARKIRDLIGRMVAQGLLPGIKSSLVDGALTPEPKKPWRQRRQEAQRSAKKPDSTHSEGRPTVGRNSPPAGQPKLSRKGREFPRDARGRPEGGDVEYWLTRNQALKVAARSETPPADALLDEMIRVFELAIDGKLRLASAVEPPLARLLRERPCDWDLMWPESWVVAISEVYGYRHDGTRQPRWLGPIYQRIYILLLGIDTYIQLKALKPSENDRDHQMLEEMARERLRSEIGTITALAACAPSKEAFWSGLEHRYNAAPLQLMLWGQHTKKLKATGS